MNKPTLELEPSECGSAAAVQAAIDRLRRTGGTVLLPEIDLRLDRGLEIYSGVELVGRGKKTVLRKAAGRVYPLSGYHNYGMRDVPLMHTEGLSVGMTVSVLDDRRKGFYSSFARIRWIDGTWVGLDRGIEADYTAAENPRLVTAYPLIFAHGVRGAAVRSMQLEGGRDQSPEPMDGCRGGAVYFAGSDAVEVEGVHEHGFDGEGLSFQMCTGMRIRESSFCDNTGNGLHPGAGSTDALFENCQGSGNDKSGFFFCVRANHITVRGCEFAANSGAGVSIGTRDCHNLIEDCDVQDNGGPGVLVRATPFPIEPHSCVLRGCRVSGNARGSGGGQITIAGDAHDIIVEATTIEGGHETAGVVAEDGVRTVYLERNEYIDCAAETDGGGFTTKRPVVECGYENSRPEHSRHLTGGV